jgi:hypothetical protein
MPAIGEDETMSRGSLLFAVRGALLLAVMLLIGCSGSRPKHTRDPDPDDPVPIREIGKLCGDLLELGAPIIHRDVEMTIPNRRSLETKIDHSIGTFCLEGDSLFGVLEVSIVVDDPGGGRRFKHTIDTAKYLDGRRLIIDLSELEPPVVVSPGDGEDGTGGAGRDPEQQPDK